MDTWSRPEQSWTKPPQTREDIAKKPFSSWTKRCKKSRQASRTIKSDRSKRKLLFSIWEQFWWAISLDCNEIAAPERRKERSAWASSRTTAEAPQTIAIFQGSLALAVCRSKICKHLPKRFMYLPIHLQVRHPP